MKSILLLAFALAAIVGAAEPNQTDIFVAGQDGYHTYRIPAIVVATNGAVLAFCEGRKNGAGDAGDIDLLLKRSLDGGHTWQKTQVVAEDGANIFGCPTPVVDRRRVRFFY
jgi:sialidase-1